jgi:hypothetical protein
MLLKVAKYGPRDVAGEAVAAEGLYRRCPRERDVAPPPLRRVQGHGRDPFEGCGSFWHHRGPKSAHGVAHGVGKQNLAIFGAKMCADSKKSNLPCRYPPLLAAKGNSNMKLCSKGRLHPTSLPLRNSAGGKHRFSPILAHFHAMCQKEMG